MMSGPLKPRYSQVLLIGVASWLVTTVPASLAAQGATPVDTYRVSTPTLTTRPRTRRG